MPEIRKPVYMRIGNQREAHVGDLVFKPGEDENGREIFVRLLRSIAQQAEGDIGAGLPLEPLGRRDEDEVSLLREVTLMLCELCLEGKGGECHTAGCALWMNRAPDVPLFSVLNTREGPASAGEEGAR